MVAQVCALIESNLVLIFFLAELLSTSRDAISRRAEMCNRDGVFTIIVSRLSSYSGMPYSGMVILY